MKKIITIQHTQSEQHINGMIGSWGNWDLTQLGIEQAHRIGKKLSSEIRNEKYILYSSDLLRAKHTADIISSYLSIKTIYSGLLREFNLGVAVGKTKKWAKENVRCPIWPNTIDWAQSKNGRVFDKSESRAEVWNRISEFYKQIVIPSENNLIIVSHDGVLSIFYAIWLGMELEMLNQYNLSGKTGGVSVMQEDDAGNRILLKLNDMAYIK